MSYFRDSLAQYRLAIQGWLFPWLSEELGELSEKQQQLIKISELIRLEEFSSMRYGYLGRPPADRTAIVLTMRNRSMRTVGNWTTYR